MHVDHIKIISSACVLHCCLFSLNACIRVMSFMSTRSRLYIAPLYDMCGVLAFLVFSTCCPYHINRLLWAGGALLGVVFFRRKQDALLCACLPLGIDWLTITYIRTSIPVYISIDVSVNIYSPPSHGPHSLYENSASFSLWGSVGWLTAIYVHTCIRYVYVYACR